MTRMARPPAQGYSLLLDLQKLTTPKYEIRLSWYDDLAAVGRLVVNKELTPSPPLTPLCSYSMSVPCILSQELMAIIIDILVPCHQSACFEIIGVAKKCTMKTKSKENH